MPKTLTQGLEKYLLPEELQKLHAACVGIAGVGGLGSNVAMLLARSGVRQFVLIDDDVVEASNLNRQQYFPRHVGMRKVDAMEEILLQLCPHIHCEKRCLRLDNQNIASVLETSALWVEALDDAVSKRLFVEHALFQGHFTVSASGIAGCGGPPMQKKNLGRYLVIVGDFTSDIATLPPLAPRVMQAAAMQADVMLARILEQDLAKV